MTHTKIAPLLGLALFLTACGGAEPAPVAPAPQSGFPSEPPAPLPVEDVDFPDYSERTLRNGARLVVVENHEQPVVSIQLLIPGAGTAADPAGQAGLASVTAALLEKGTESMTSAEIAEAADFLGARLGASASSEWSAVSLTSITDFLDRGLALMSDIVLHPTFPDEELATEKTRRASALRLNRSQAGALAAETFTTELYGAHPYGQVETAESIEALEADGVARFHMQRYRPDGALFVVAGDVDPAEIARKLELAFAGWEGGQPTRNARPAAPTRSGRDMVFVHKPGSVQAVIRIGHLFPSATDADWVTLDVANQVLGSPSAAFTAWMMSTLREEKGFTYGAYSIMSERLGPGTFVMQGEFRNAVADSALEIMFDLAERLRSGDVPAEHLDRARNYLTGSFPLNIETPQQVAGQVASNRLLGRDDAYLERYRGEVAEVDAQDVGEAAREHIHPDRMLIVVVGDAGEVLEMVRPFADRVRVVDTEGRPVDPARLAAAPEVGFDASGLEPRTMEYGLLFQGNEVGTATTEWSREGGRFVVVSAQTVPGARLEQTTTFDAASLAPISLVSSLGPMGEFSLTVEDGRATGSGMNPETGQAQDVDVTLTPGTVLDGMPDVAIAVHDFEAVEEFALRVLAGTGDIQASSVRLEGTETVEVPAGSFDTYRLDVGGQQPMTVWVTRSSPHIVVRRQLVQPPIEVVL
ncbi:MAG TPA: insulinase family protein, partial [Longimicrobiales bacterium]|nr:insulinase family protein [Longimicrobiales bacterium]